jgi:hypothetical protein
LYQDILLGTSSVKLRIKGRGERMGSRARVDGRQRSRAVLLAVASLAMLLANVPSLTA